MRLRIDLSELQELERKVTAQLAQLPAQIQELTKAAAKMERREHDYQNRTGLLQRNTTGVLIRATRKMIHTQLRMNRPYASFVVAKGLSTIGDQAKGLEVGIEHLMSNIGR